MRIYSSLARTCLMLSALSCRVDTNGLPTQTGNSDTEVTNTNAATSTSALASTSATLPTTSGMTSTTSTTSTTDTATVGTDTTGTATTGIATTGPNCGVGRCEDIDVLLVIDNSPSMASKLQVVYTLFFAISEVVFPMLLEACSVRLGVLTTDEFAKNPEECRKLGALVRGDVGEPCPFVEGNAYATSLDLDTPDPAAFSCVLSVGLEGNSDERLVDAIVRSFSDTRNVDCNFGFHRKGAFLLLVMVTDEDDGDANDPQGHNGSADLPPDLWFNSLKVLKGGDLRDLYIGAILGDEDQETTACPWQPLAGTDGEGASSAPILRSFLNQFPAENRTVGSLCNLDPQVRDYLPMMGELVSEVRSLCEPG